MIIKSAEYIEDYKIKVTFKDGLVKIADFKPFLTKTQHPEIKKFLDKELFKTFYIEHNCLRWHGNQFDIGAVSIYNGEFDAKKHKRRKSQKQNVLTK